MKTTSLFLLCMMVAAVGCSHKEQTPANNASGGTQSAATPIPAAVKAKEFASLNFTDVAITTSNPPAARLRFDVKNGSQDPLLCDESSFSAQLSDGTVLSPDAGAENTCTPDSIDPGSTAQATIFFDLPSGYTGSIDVIMKSPDNTVVGDGTTNIH